MKDYVRWIVLGAALVLGLASAAPSRAQGEGALIRFEPETIQVGVGQTETISMIVENAREIYGIDVRAKFDPNVLEVVDADASKDGVQMTAGDFIKPDFQVRNEANNKAGTLEYVITQVNPTPPATGSGTVLKIMVRGKAQGKTSPLEITFVETADRHGTKLAITSQNGTVQIVAPKPETATPRATAQGSATATRRAGATQPARTPTRPRPTSSGASNTGSDLLTNLVLITIAIGGCLGALVILGIGLFFALRRPRNMPPHSTPTQRGGPS